MSFARRLSVIFGQLGNASAWVPGNITDNVYAEILFLRELEKKETAPTGSATVAEKVKGPKNIQEAIANSIRFLTRELSGHVKLLSQHNQPKELYKEMAIEQSGYGMICPLGDVGQCLLLPKAIKDVLPIQMQHLTPEVEKFVKATTGKLIYYDPALFAQRVREANEKHQREIIREGQFAAEAQQKAVDRQLKW